MAISSASRKPSNKRLQLTPNSSFQSIRGTVLPAGALLRGGVRRLQLNADPLGSAESR